MKPGYFFLALASFTLIGCNKDDKVLLDKYKAQKEELADLEFQVQRASRKLRENHIPDPSEEIAGIQLKIDETEEQKEVLLEQLAEIKNSVKEAGEKLANYKAKYPLNPK